MAMGKRRHRAQQKTMQVASADLPRSAGRPFYERLNRVLDDAGFDAFVEAHCAKFHRCCVDRRGALGAESSLRHERRTALPARAGRLRLSAARRASQG